MFCQTQIKLIIAIIFIFLNCSCKPRFKDPSNEFKKDLVNASPDFKQGWHDGCESGMASGSNSFNQVFYKNNKVDGYKISYSSEYQTAWNNAWWFCYRKDYVNQKSMVYGSFFGGYK